MAQHARTISLANPTTTETTIPNENPPDVRNEDTREKEKETQCLTFRVHVQPRVKLENSAQFAAFYTWMQSSLEASYYVAEASYMGPSQDFKLPTVKASDCEHCQEQEG